MKRILFSSALLLAASATSLSAKDIYTHDTSVLPPAAKELIADNFRSKVSVIKVDKDFGRITDYEVTLTDGTEITFDRGGNWQSIETAPGKAVPSNLVLPHIRAYVKAHQQGARIVSIEKEGSAYDVDLSNGVDIKFSAQGNYLRFDD